MPVIAAGVRAVDPAALLARLPPAPRLLLPRCDLAALRRTIAADPAAAAVHAAGAAHAARLVAEPLVLPAALGLGTARATLDRAWTLGLRWRLDGDAAAADRLRADILAVARLGDWSGDNFLFTAETTHAVAIAHDWLHDRWTPAERTEVSGALVRLGLRAFERAHAERAWWTMDTCNWNTVCNGAAILAALAAHEADPRLARRVLGLALGSIGHSLATFAPDGGWPEGPGYWGFATRYLTVVCAALDAACGDDCGIPDLPGVAQAADFRLHCEGALPRLFNFADCAEAALPDPSLLWLARRHRRPGVAAFARRGLRSLQGSPTYGAAARALLFWDTAGTDRDLAALPLDARFSEAAVACFRSAWDDPRAWYVAIKGGDIQASHAHADLGSFVLDALGQRWFLDPGPDAYDLPGWWNGRPGTDGARWRWHRAGSHGHNALLVGGAQDPLGWAPLADFSSAPARGAAVVDLAAAHPAARAVRRGVALAEGRRAVWLRDEVASETALPVEWQAFTAAAVSVDGLHATLRLGGETLHAVFACDAAAELAVEEVDLAPPQLPLRCRRLVLRTRCAGTLTIAVRIAADAQAPVAATLDAWCG